MEYVSKPDFGVEDENYCAAKLIFDESRLKETSEDFILPDYLPDIKKIAAVFPEANVKGRFIGSGTLEYDGEVRYKILYISEDRTPKSVTFVTGFDDKIGNERLTEDCIEQIEPVVSGLFVRLLNPRKVNIRASIGADVSVYERHCYLPELYGARTAEDESRIKCTVREVQGCNLTSLRENGLTLSEDLNFEAVMPTAEELIFADARLIPQDCRIGEGEVQIRGTAEICCILSAGKDVGEKEELIRLDRSLNFTQTLKSKDLHEGGICFADLYTEGCEFRLREDEFGQKRVVEFDMTYLCDMTVYSKKEVRVVTDGFSTEKETDLSFEKENFIYPASALKGGFSVSEGVTVDLPDDGSYTLFDCFAFPSLHLSGEENEKTVLEGECAVVLLLKDSAGAPDVRRVTLPLRFRTDLAKNGEKGKIGCRVSGARWRLDKNILSCDFEVNYYGILTGEETLDAVTALRLLPDTRRNTGKRGSILLYYPEKDETAFSVAKKYAVEPSELEKQMKNGAFPLMIERK